MRIINFAKRNFKELIRDPLSLVFEIVLPIFLLFIFQQFNIPEESFKLNNFTPGMIIFGFSFITLFTSNLIAKDRESSLLIRLGVSPMRPYEFILGYIISIVPIVILQSIMFFLVAIMLGLDISINIIFAILISIIVSLLFIALGILIGSLVSEKASSGLGSIVVQLVCFTSGMYFSKDLVGKGFATICELLPFESTLNIIKGVLNDYQLISIQNIVVFIIYTMIVVLISIIVFKNKMFSDK